MKKIKISLYISTFLITYVVLHVYFAYVVHVYLQATGSKDLFVPLIILFTLFGFLFPVGQMVQSLRIFKTFGAMWFGFIQFALVVFPALHITVLVSSEIFLERQNAVLIAGTVAVIMLMFYLFLGIYQAYSPVTKSYQIKLDYHDQNRKELKIALVTDTHFGPLAGSRSVKKLTDMLMNEQPELILFAGDVVDDDPAFFKQHDLSRYFKELNPSMGMFGVLGNHEYYGGKRDEIVKILEESGIKMLLDDQVTLDNDLIIIGRKDRTDKRRKSVQDLMTGVLNNANLPVLMMDHQPSELSMMTDYPVDVTVSGHTHKGQIWPNQMFTRKIFPLDYGYRQFGNMHSIVSSGFGFWGPPIRIGSRAELVLINVSYSSLAKK
ncbi:metallophosphoesterase [Salisediminibacterium beveridgei]|uniref:metallophosphoesterase n=1 Tax=Salisediminibacterium beveridgei TaxID=632773 RepID=UPI0008482126|nr:metallophosphoesterase [Salisediminibacterium beveridgei]